MRPENNFSNVEHLVTVSPAHRWLLGHLFASSILPTVFAAMQENLLSFSLCLESDARSVLSPAVMKGGRPQAHATSFTRHLTAKPDHFQ